jgi:hypothetical protein
MLKRLLALAVYMSAVLWMPTHAWGSVIYSNISPAFPGDGGSTYGADVGYVGTTFTTTAGGILGQIDLSIVVVGSPTIVPAGLYTNSGDAPDMLLESWNVLVPTSPNSNLLILTSLLNPVLSASTQYWFVFNDGPTPATTSWLANDESVPGGIWSGSSSLTGMVHTLADSPAPGIQLLSTPEPGTGVLLGAGCLALAGIRRALRSRRRSV